MMNHNVFVAVDASSFVCSAPPEIAAGAGDAGSGGRAARCPGCGLAWDPSHRCGVPAIYEAAGGPLPSVFDGVVKTLAGLDEERLAGLCAVVRFVRFRRTWRRLGSAVKPVGAGVFIEGL